MNWSKVIKVGFELLAATVAGFAVFAGIDQSIHRKKNINQQDSVPGGVNSNPECGNFGNNQTPPNPMKPMDDDQKPRFSDKVVAVADGLRGATSMCSKLLSFTQSLTSVVDSFNQIFRQDNQPPYCYPPYGYGGYGYNGDYQYQQMGGQIWRRWSPFIVEAVPGGNYSRNTQYPL